MIACEKKDNRLLQMNYPEAELRGILLIKK